MSRYVVRVVFSENDGRQGMELKGNTVVSTNHLPNERLFIAEVLKELAYGDCKDLILQSKYTGCKLEGFDYHLLNLILKGETISLADKLLSIFEISSLEVFDCSGRIISTYSR